LGAANAADAQLTAQSVRKTLLFAALCVVPMWYSVQVLLQALILSSNIMFEHMISVCSGTCLSYIGGMMSVMITAHSSPPHDLRVQMGCM
jgi:hypothetical protein